MRLPYTLHLICTVHTYVYVLYNTQAILVRERERETETEYNYVRTYMYTCGECGVRDLLFRE